MMVQGGRHPARAMRLLIRDLARGRKGVAEAADLKVRSLDTPGPAVRVGEGSAVIDGALPWQGAYAQANVGDTLVPVPPTGPFARTDLLVLRIEDPEYEGNRKPGEDIGYFELIHGVDPQQTTMPRGMTAIPLARITLPRNTAAVTAEMISDLRQLANPRHERIMHTARPTRTEELPGEHGQWTTWPTPAGWDLDVPTWATHTTTVITLAGLGIDNGNVYAQFRTTLGEEHGDEVALDDGQGRMVRPAVVVLADTFALPSTYRGTLRRLSVQTNQNDQYGRGELTVRTGTAIVADVEFTESPV
jgi:hypothetical protein